MPRDHIRAKVIRLRNAAAKSQPACLDKSWSFPDPGPAGFDFSLLDDEAEKSGEARVDDQSEADE